MNLFVGWSIRLWAGIDLTKAPQEAIEIFLNKDVIAVDQDPLGEGLFSFLHIYF